MKGIIKSIFILTILSFSLLSACSGGQSADVPPNADHLVQFNEAGIAVIRGPIESSAWHQPANGRYDEKINIAIPIKVDGIKASLTIPIVISYDTEIASSQVPKTTVREHLIFHPRSYVAEVFRNTPLLEVTFRKNGTVFEAVSIKEVEKKPQLFQTQGTINGFFQKDSYGRPIAGGSISQAMKDVDGSALYWMLSAGIPAHGVNANVIVQVKSTPETKITTSQGTFNRTTDFDWSLVQIVYTRRGGKMIAKEITALP